MRLNYSGIPLQTTMYSNVKFTWKVYTAQNWNQGFQMDMGNMTFLHLALHPDMSIIQWAFALHLVLMAPLKSIQYVSWLYHVCIGGFFFF